MEEKPKRSRFQYSLGTIAIALAAGILTELMLWLWVASSPREMALLTFLVVHLPATLTLETLKPGREWNIPICAIAGSVQFFLIYWGALVVSGWARARFRPTK
ncbi:MAG: hypothetical protein K8T25_18735 [Planctomycetia bacterium]|nr:hypothetical protein [Planctomycetia bacterium]